MSPTISKLLKIRDFGDGLIFPFLNVRGMLGRCQIVQKMNHLVWLQCLPKVQKNWHDQTMVSRAKLPREGQKAYKIFIHREVIKI